MKGVCDEGAFLPIACLDDGRHGDKRHAPLGTVQRNLEVKCGAEAPPW